MITLYHNEMSTCSQKVRLCLAEKRLDWKSRHLDLRAGEQQQDWYVKLNPRQLNPRQWALLGRPAMPQWSVGRITLLGDDCHPTLPFLGQGAVMALEDGYVLAAALAKHAEHATAFARYERERRPRTAAVVEKAAANRDQAFQHQLADRDTVALAVAQHWQQERLRERMDWLYTYDATAVEV